MANPLVTILMPAYNVAPYIGDAIQSVLQQEFTDYELLVIDDGSTDETALIVEQFSDSRLRFIKETHKGLAAILNLGLEKAKAELIARFDSDDICMPGRLEKQFRFLQDHPDYVVTGCDAQYITATGDFLFNFTCLGHTDAELKERIYFYCPFIHSGVMYRKDAVLKAGAYSLHAHSFEDYLLWVKLAGLGKFHNLAEPLIKVRFHPESVTIDEKWRTSLFRKIKRDIILRGNATAEEGTQLLNLLEQQNKPKIKKASYHALCGKKYLTENHQPKLARKHIGKAISLFPWRADSYLLYLLSFFPMQFINWLHQKSPNRI